MLSEYQGIASIVSLEPIRKRLHKKKKKPKRKYKQKQTSKAKSRKKLNKIA